MKTGHSLMTSSLTVKSAERYPTLSMVCPLAALNLSHLTLGLAIFLIARCLRNHVSDRVVTCEPVSTVASTSTPSIWMCHLGHLPTALFQNGSFELSTGRPSTAETESFPEPVLEGPDSQQ